MPSTSRDSSSCPSLASLAAAMSRAAAGAVRRSEGVTVAGVPAVARTAGAVAPRRGRDDALGGMVVLPRAGGEQVQPSHQGRRHDRVRTAGAVAPRRGRDDALGGMVVLAHHLPEVLLLHEPLRLHALEDLAPSLAALLLRRDLVQGERRRRRAVLRLVQRRGDLLVSGRAL